MFCSKGRIQYKSINVNSDCVNRVVTVSVLNMWGLCVHCMFVQFFLSFSSSSMYLACW